jgi:uncharacterized DUF497 family protein
MEPISFEWDERKNTENKRKYRVSFEEARTVFLDDHARLIADPDHSEEEDRFVLLGVSSAFRTLVVVHTYRRRESTIRIISARRAQAAERAAYLQGRSE